MSPHTNARYGRNEIGMGNMFADYFKQITRYNSERKGWYVYDGSVWRPDKGGLKVSELAKLLARGEVDYVTFTSASTVHGFVGSLPADTDLTKFTALCIGPSTQKAAQQAGMKTITAANATIDAMIETLRADCAAADI